MAYKNSRPRTPEQCPLCGEDVPPRALACPECGADHNSGWKADADLSGGLDLPDEEFDYEEFVEREFGSQTVPSHIKPVWWITAIVVLVAFIAWLVLAVI